MRVRVEIWDKKFRYLLPEIKRAALKLGRFLRLKNVYIEIYLVGDNFMRKNVLSFPAPKEFPRPDIGKKYEHLGEIYLNPDHIRRECLKIENCKLKIAFMLIHGLLHLLGYDHKRKNDTMIMQKKEKQLLKLL